MRTNKTLNHCKMNAAAWGWHTEKLDSTKDGISVGLYKKPSKKELADTAYSLVELFSDNGELVCQVNVKRLKEHGVKLVMNEKE